MSLALVDGPAVEAFMHDTKSFDFNSLDAESNCFCYMLAVGVLTSLLLLYAQSGIANNKCGGRVWEWYEVL